MATLNTLIEPIIAFVPRLASAVLILAAGVFLIPAGHRFVKRLTSHARNKNALAWLAGTVFLVVAWVVLLAAFFSALGFPQIGLALSGALSLLALAIGTAAKDTVADFIGGFFLTADHDFKLGYIVKTGDVEGRIVEIDWRKTRLLSRNGKVHVIPNRQVEAAEWVVLDRSGLV